MPVLYDVARKCNLLASFDHTNNGKLERKVEDGPYLLSDGSIMTMGESVEIQRPYEYLIIVSYVTWGVLINKSLKCFLLVPVGSGGLPKPR